ncbi:MAG: GNAT family N-acetyltransferase [Candidatus Daviesbacteria bacterium]|nr:GNAT family N-acetyltransferase [Candidatus Daviesbacteria bacterium]
MKLKIFKRSTKAIVNFAKKEWENADKEHYGKAHDFSSKKFILAAYNGTEIIGKVSLIVRAGVGEVQEVIVAKLHRGTGVGKSLMLKIEEIAKKNNAHKLWLNTGKGWSAEEFYKNLGYEKTADLPNHYLKRDFVEYSKYI